MDGWGRMDGCADELVDEGWIDGGCRCADASMNARTDGWMDGLMEMGGWMGERMVDGRMDWMDGWTDWIGCMD